MKKNSRQIITGKGRNALAKSSRRYGGVANIRQESKYISPLTKGIRRKDKKRDQD